MMEDCALRDQSKNVTNPQQDLDYVMAFVIHCIMCKYVEPKLFFNPN